ncbi:Sodium-coupled monocarboxylate transporter 2 [Armadillidium nasatum]|uniref:Sodium-coupled monocarboxylate transporter 2 n=1 Tax=Armadillidium nasatum TaxID=96803 RepID=A0A5N5TA79_9CRUS|nr:Sodium-coupled monocarboxylate transporter 2 [Armadillidium nasatum]
MDNKTEFGVADYCAFVGMLIISSAIGFYVSYKGNKSPEEFLVGDRSMKPFPVSMSLITSFVSAISLLGLSGETYANGMQIITYTLGVPLAIIFSSHFVVPVLYPLKLISINEYIELRFKSKRLRLVMFLVTEIFILAFSSICLYSSTIALSSVTNLSTLSNIFILGVGGIKAVIWTDVFQFTVMMIGMITILAVGCAQVGGFIETLHIASGGGRLEIFNMNPSPFVRHTFINTIPCGFFYFLQMYSVDQVNTQRICAVNSTKNAKRVLNYNIYGLLLVYFLTFSCGLVAYASYVGCDPMALGIITKKDQIMTYFVTDKLSFIPGLPGLFVATIIGGTMSTVSSYINGCMAQLWKDVCLKFKFFKDASIPLVIGFVLIALAILASNSSSILEMTITVSGTIYGPILGVFLIGFFLPNCNLKGVWTGFIGSSAFMLWLTIGALLYKKPTKMLSFSAAECVGLNSSSLNVSNIHEIISPFNGTMKESISDTSSINSLYQISYTLYI